MANTALEILKSSIGFLTTIPLKGEIEVLRRNLWIFSFIGAFLGFLISIPAIFNLSFLCIIFYVAFEGINHIDGLADFGDAFFAPESKKKTALKDTQIGAGGVTFLSLYFLILFYSFPKVGFIDIIFAQITAKYSMLILLVTSKPAWEGMGAFMMEFARKKDLAIGFLPLFISVLSPEYLISLLFSILLVFWMQRYAEARFGGISGDILGAANCLTFASTLVLNSLIQF
ncbi:MAG: adenosylcobinamide-GDP ribazoletransferase [Archaeoglobaceae archaeon]